MDGLLHQPDILDRRAHRRGPINQVVVRSHAEVERCAARRGAIGRETPDGILHEVARESPLALKHRLVGDQLGRFAIRRQRHIRIRAHLIGNILIARKHPCVVRIAGLDHVGTAGAFRAGALLFHVIAVPLGAVEFEPHVGLLHDRNHRKHHVGHECGR